MAGKGRCYVSRPVSCNPRRLAFRMGCITGNNRIIKEGYNESYHLEPDSVGGCNRHGVVAGSEHTHQRAGTTATKPRTAKQQKAERQETESTAGQE